MYNSSKKGQIGEGWALFVSTLLIIMMLVAFFFVIRTFMESADNAAAAEEFSLRNSAKSSLGAFLETPVTIQMSGKSLNVTIADLIELARVNETYRADLEKESSAIFKKVYNEKYKLEISSWLTIGFTESTVYNPDIGESVPQYEPRESYFVSLPNNMGVKLSLKKW